MSRHPASILALVNGGMVFGMSMLTRPGGVFPKLSFKSHRTGDIVQAVRVAGQCSSVWRRPGSEVFLRASGKTFVMGTTHWNAA